MKLPRSSRIPTIKLAKDAENQAYLDMLAVAKNGQPRLQQFPRSASAIGDELSILYLPGEMFAEYQLFAQPGFAFQAYAGFCLYQQKSRLCSQEESLRLRLCGRLRGLVH